MSKSLLACAALALALTATGCSRTVCAPGTVRTGDACAFPASHLTVVRSGNGTGLVTSDQTGIDCGGTCSATFPHGLNITLTVTPDVGSTFAGWSGDCMGTSSCTLYLDSDKTVTATFTRIQEILTVSTGGVGTGTVTSTPAGIDCGATCSASFDWGTVVTLNAAPDATSLFGGWSGDCAGTTPCMLTMDASHSATAVFDLPGQYRWSRAFGAASGDRVVSIAFDPPASVVVAGSFATTASFGGSVLVNAGAWDVFVGRYSALDGSHQWSRGFGSTGYDLGNGVAADSAGDVFLGGVFLGTVDFGGGGLTSAGAADAFLAKLAGPNGAHLWSRRFGAANPDGIEAVATDTSGDVFVTGYFVGTVDFGGGGLTSDSGSPDIFLAKYSGVDGSYLWARRMGSAGDEQGRGIAVDLAGDVVLTGYFSGTVDFGGGPLSTTASADGFVAKYAGPDGRHLWSRRLGGGSSMTGAAVTTDSSGSVIVTGSFLGTISVGSTVLTSAGGADIFVAKYAQSNGIEMWAHRFGGSLDDNGQGVATDAGNNVLVAGLFADIAYFRGSSIAANGSFDALVLKYSSLGEELWARGFGGAGPDGALGAVSIDPMGRSVAVGTFSPPVDFGGGPLAMGDVFLLGLGP